MGLRNYYYLVAGLPDLTIDQGKLQFGSKEFREILKNELHKADYELIEWLFLPADNRNLIHLLTNDNREWDDSGLYSREDLELAILEEVNPDKILDEKPWHVKAYLKEFIKAWVTETRQSPELMPENELASLYYTDALKVKNQFLREWFEFEINLKNVIVWNAARRHNIPFENDIVGNTPLASLLRQKTGSDMGEAAEWKYFEAAGQLGETNNSTGRDIAGKEKAIDNLRWTVLDEMNIFNYFSIEVIISYMLKLMIVERWLKLDPKAGEELFRRLLGDLQSGYEFPNEFSLNNGKR